MVALTREAVSVVVPFHGSAEAAEGVLILLGQLIAPMDEAILVDNTETSVADGVQPPPGTRVLSAPLQQSSYFARNAGAEVAGSEWILFVDSDCRPQPGLLDRYFAPPLPADCGIVAGGVVAAAGQTGVVPRWAKSRGHVSEAYHVGRGPMPAGITANLLVRRAAWTESGGFQEGIRSGGDLEFCWRVQELGWGFEHRPHASVEHVHVESLRPLLRKGARYGAGRTWVERRYPGSSPRPRLSRELPKALLGGLCFPAMGQAERGLFKLIDGLWYSAVAWGHLVGENRAGPAPEAARAGDIRFVAGQYPDNQVPAAASVEAVARPARPNRGLLLEGPPVTYVEDDRPVDRLRSFLRAALGNPVRVLISGFGRLGWRDLLVAAPAACRARVGGVKRLESDGSTEGATLASGVAALARIDLH